MAVSQAVGQKVCGGAMELHCLPTSKWMHTMLCHQNCRTNGRQSHRRTGGNLFGVQTVARLSMLVGSALYSILLGSCAMYEVEHAGLSAGELLTTLS